MKYYAVYNDDSYMKRFKTLNEAKQFIKEANDFDKRHGNPFDEQYKIISGSKIVYEE